MERELGKDKAAFAKSKTEQAAEIEEK